MSVAAFFMRATGVQLFPRLGPGLVAGRFAAFVETATMHLPSSLAPEERSERVRIRQRRACSPY